MVFPMAQVSDYYRAKHPPDNQPIAATTFYLLLLTLCQAGVGAMIKWTTSASFE